MITATYQHRSASPECAIDEVEERLQECKDRLVCSAQGSESSSDRCSLTSCLQQQEDMCAYLSTDRLQYEIGNRRYAMRLSLSWKFGMFSCQGVNGPLVGRRHARTGMVNRTPAHACHYACHYSVHRPMPCIAWADVITPAHYEQAQ